MSRMYTWWCKRPCPKMTPAEQRQISDLSADLAYFCVSIDCEPRKCLYNGVRFDAVRWWVIQHFTEAIHPDWRIVLKTTSRSRCNHRQSLYVTLLSKVDVTPAGKLASMTILTQSMKTSWSLGVVLGEQISTSFSQCSIAGPVWGGIHIAPKTILLWRKHPADHMLSME